MLVKIVNKSSCDFKALNKINFFTFLDSKLYNFYFKIKYFQYNCCFYLYMEIISVLSHISLPLANAMEQPTYDAHIIPRFPNKLRILSLAIPFWAIYLFKKILFKFCPYNIKKNLIFKTPFFVDITSSS